MKSIIIYISILVVISIFIAGSSPAFDKPLRTEAANAADVAGTFTLILYGSRHFNDIETVAIFDIEGDRYTFEPYAPEFDYSVKKGISAKEAMVEAERFVSWHSSFYRSQLSRVIDTKGDTIGYELRPLYDPLTFGISDVLDVDYALRDTRVRVFIRLKPSVERQLLGGDGLRERDE